MADIDIQKKSRGGSIWPWLLGLLAAVLLVWAVVEAVDTDDAELTQEEIAEPGTDMQAMPSEAEDPMDVLAAVNAYTSFVEGDGQGAMGLSHEFTASALTHLSQALDAVVETEGNGDLQLEATRDTLEARARMIQQDPQATTHARRVHAAFTAATDLMEQLQENRYPDLNEEVTQVQQAVQAVTPDGELLDQREAVYRFFTEAGDALQRIAEQTNEMAMR